MKNYFHLAELESSKFLSKLTRDYLRHEPKLASFFGRYPSVETLRQQLLDKATNFSPCSREVLYTALLKQTHKFSSTRAQTLQSIKKLRDKNTYCITTGHQPCLFLGPLYFLNKIVHTIKLAHYLEDTIAGINVVPIFWLASEDHDFEEISAIKALGRSIKWSNAGVGGAVGRMKLENIEWCVEDLKNCLYKELRNEANKGAEILNFYRPNRTLAEATTDAINCLFGDQGLVVVDGDDAILKRHARELFANDIFSDKNYAAINEACSGLRKLGYKPQLNPREINTFHLEGQKRTYVQKSVEGFKIERPGGINTFTEPELRDYLEQHPERFSPNAALRPLYQEYSLPNLAYVGGSNEIAYWLELKGAFQANKLTFPMLVVRHAAILLSPAITRKLGDLGLEVLDVLNAYNEVIARVCRRELSQEHALNKEKEAVSTVLDELKRRYSRADCQNMVQASSTKVLKILARLEKRLIARHKGTIERKLQDVEQIRKHLAPEGGMQDRNESALVLLARYPELLKMLEVSFTSSPLESKAFIYTLRAAWLGE